MKKKKIFWIIIILIIIAGVIIWRNLIKKEKEEYTLHRVGRGTVLQEVSETGTVKRGEEINLSFKNVGIIEKIYVAVGEKVKTGQSLAKLDTKELAIQLTEAQAAKQVAQANLDKLLAGATLEEIQISETVVANAKVSLGNVKQNLVDVQAKAQRSLNSAYESALNTLKDAYLEIDNSANLVSKIQRSYFSSSDQETIQAEQIKIVINLASAQAKNFLDSVENLTFANDNEESYNKVDQALSGVKKELQRVSENLAILRQLCERPNYWHTVSSTDKTSLDNQKAAINTDLTNIVNVQQSISSTKITNEANINTAKAEVSAAQGVLKKAEDELALKKAEPRQEDIDFYQAQLKQAEAKINLFQRQIEDSSLISPTNGQITKIKKRVGETAQPTAADFVVTILSEIPFQIEVDIYEEDVVKVEIGDPVDIALVAFANQIFKGRVVAIDPAEKIINEVVYYQTSIDFEEIPMGIKPGMTADITIKTAFKENVLVVPKRAVNKKDNRVFVEVLKNGNIEQREIETGILGTDNLVEVVSGLAEGEEILIR